MSGVTADEREVADALRVAAGDLLRCAGIAHHLIVSEGWRVAESNADAVRALGQQQVVPASTAEAVARA